MPSSVVTTRVLRELTLRRDPGSVRPAHVAAASGLVTVGRHLYVIADDEAGIGRWEVGSPEPGELLVIFPEVLPTDPITRKAQKPDLEALTLLPPHDGAPHGALLALGSGSTPARRRGVRWVLDEDGAPAGDPEILDLTPLYAALEAELGGLNVEGATVREADVLLAHRGVGARRASAIATLAREPVLAALSRGDDLGPDLVARVERHDLGELDGVALAFSDLSALPDGRVVYAAAAEDTSDPFHDGEVTGSAVGVLGEGEPRRVEPMTKVEGVRAEPGEDGIELLLVSDADDRATPAPLMAGRL